jgi:hypothetical protein
MSGSFVATSCFEGCVVETAGKFGGKFDGTCVSKRSWPIFKVVGVMLGCLEIGKIDGRDSLISIEENEGASVATSEGITDAGP